MEEKKYYVCEECDDRMIDDALIPSATPMFRTMNEQLKDIWLSFHPGQDYDPKPEKLYHNVHVYKSWGGTSGMRLCGPVHEETQQEYFLHWLGVNSKRFR